MTEQRPAPSPQANGATDRPDQTGARPEAIDNAPMARDATRWNVRRPVLSGLAATAILLIGAGGWAASARLQGAVVAPGQIAVQHDRQVVQHQEGGMVAAILVGEGELVSAGQPLLRLDDALATSELAIVESQYLETLARLGRLAAEREGADSISFPAPLQAALDAGNQSARDIADGQARLLDARRDTLAQQLAQIERQQAQGRAQIDGLGAQVRAARAEAALIATELATQENLLARGLTQATRVAALQREAARLEGMQGALAAETAQLESRLGELALQALTLHALHRAEAEAEMRDAGIRALELAERRSALSARIERLTLRAPIGGRVHGMSVTTTGGVLRPAQPAMEIVPQDRPLVIAARIRPEDIQSVHPGQQAGVQIVAPGLRDAGPLRGTITSVSADTFQDERTGLRHFRAEIRLGEAAAQRFAERPLMPGMAAEVFIETGARSALDYLTAPLFDQLRRAWREP
ncbi:MAG: HlyD family type I secretion periplasmic adaptor subunit [Pararhodobacter sp.]|nr:HlyD family type I secretion periplasmic adaptor subunit [Pararhodobacter sp.]